ncbi:MAG TPA: hypothetical protein DCM32_05385 [Xanthomonadaceae bacterium]|jgi:DNA-binding SARP family transcriptional activator|nr:hypothetical protein [Xanthomonadaceae bacterium]
MLSVHLLGERRLLHAGSDVGMSIQYRKGWALLGYLLVEGGRRHSREYLAELLWPTLPALAARTNLRQVVANLNRAFEAHGAGGVLIATRDDIAVHPRDSLVVDVHRLEQAVDAGAEALLAAEAALLGVSGAFLEGIAVDDCPAYEAWLLPTRARLSGATQRALVRLFDAQVASGRSRGAIASARRLVELDPWDDLATRRLMGALAADGRHDEALAAFEALRMALKIELGAAPAPATLVLRDRLRAERGGTIAAAGASPQGRGAGARQWLCGLRLHMPPDTAEGLEPADVLTLVQALREGGAWVLSTDVAAVHAGVPAGGNHVALTEAARHATRLAREAMARRPGIAASLCPVLVQPQPGGGYAVVGNPESWTEPLVSHASAGLVLACDSLFDSLFESFALHPEVYLPVPDMARPLRIWRVGAEGTDDSVAWSDAEATTDSGDRAAALFDSDDAAALLTLRLGDAPPVVGESAVDAWLTVVEGPERGVRAAVAGGPLVVGRSPDSDLQLPRRTVSRHHCAVWRDGEHYRVRDLGATNRTRVNGAVVLETRLREGDLLAVGEYTLRFGREL